METDVEILPDHPVVRMETANLEKIYATAVVANCSAVHKPGSV